MGFSADVGSYLELTGKIEKFFPNRGQRLSLDGQGYFTKDFYRSNDKSATSILITKPLPPISKGKKVVTFYSPYAMGKIDNKLAESAKQEVNGSSSTTSPDSDKPSTSSGAN